MRLLAVTALLLLAAAAPPGTDPNSPLARWIHTMRDPIGRSCCGEGDCCHTALQQDSSGQRWAWIGRDQFGADAPNAWEPISEEVWRKTTAAGDPPDGRAYVCFWGGEVHCARSSSGN